MHDYRLEPDIIDAEVSRLVNGAISGKNPRRWRSSTSSGYSSHSPPLSAGSYSTCCASVLRSSATGTIADVGLAVIHEADIPRPIWPCNGGDRDCHFEGNEVDLCNSCGYTKIHPNPGKCRPCRESGASAIARNSGPAALDSGPSARNSGPASRDSDPASRDLSSAARDSGSPGRNSGTARDVLLELSRTLNSVIDGANTMTAEEVLRDISRTVAHGIQTNVNGSDEHVYRYPSTSSSGMGKESVNPVNLRLYGKSGYVNPVSLKSYPCNYDSKNCPAVFLVPRCHGICSKGVRCAGKSGNEGNGVIRGIEESKRKRGATRLEANTVKGCYASNEPVYSTVSFCLIHF